MATRIEVTTHEDKQPRYISDSDGYESVNGYYGDSEGFEISKPVRISMCSYCFVNSVGVDKCPHCGAPK